ncbi:MAG TPA: hypothetical protein PKZ76_08230 [Xanthomonadaceae bacterium]|nr:hypothetical protein [Xanthomonadaceae bacterium]
MYKRPALAVIFAAALLSMNAQAVDLILSTSNGNCTFPLQTNSSVSINPSTGNVLAALSSSFDPTTSGCAALGEPAQAPTFTTPLRVNGGTSVTLPTAAAGQQVSMSWATANAAYCDRTGTVYPAGYSTTSVTNWPGATNIVLGVSANPLTITMPGNSDTTASKVFTFGLRCTGIVSPAANANTVSVTLPAADGGEPPPPPPPGCVGATWPDGYARATTSTIKFNNNQVQNVDATQFASVFKGISETTTPWPGNGSTRSVRVPRTGFIAMQFTIPLGSTFTTWRLLQEDHGDSSAPRRPATVTVSQCPGHFNLTGENALDPRCIFYPDSVQGQFVTAVVNNAATHGGSTCPVQRGLTYYLNIIHHDPRNGTAMCEQGLSTCSWFGLSDAQ